MSQAAPFYLGSDCRLGATSHGRLAVGQQCNHKCFVIVPGCSNLDCCQSCPWQHMGQLRLQSGHQPCAAVWPLTFGCRIKQAPAPLYPVCSTTGCIDLALQDGCSQGRPVQHARRHPSGGAGPAQARPGAGGGARRGASVSCPCWPQTCATGGYLQGGRQGCWKREGHQAAGGWPATDCKKAGSACLCQWCGPARHAK